MKINVFKPVQVEAKTLKIHMKVSDTFGATLEDEQGEQLVDDYEGYVPSFMPEDHHGDYLILDIDIDTGQITNWTKPTEEEIEQFIQEANNEE